MVAGEAIKRSRREAGVSQAELAQAVGVDERTVRRYERGDTEPSLGIAVLIARHLGVSIDALYGGNAAAAHGGTEITAAGPTGG